MLLASPVNPQLDPKVLNDSMIRSVGFQGTREACEACLRTGPCDVPEVGLDRLKQKLSAVKSKVQTVQARTIKARTLARPIFAIPCCQAKTAHDAIGAALLKVKEKAIFHSRSPGKLCKLR